MRYVRVVDEKVVEVIFPTYDEENNFIPVELRYTPDFVKTLVESPSEEVIEGYSYKAGIFSPPTPYKPSPEDVISINKQKQNFLLSLTRSKLAPLQYAEDLEIATDKEISQIGAWKRYGVYVNRVDLTDPEPEWPVMPKE